MKMRYRRFFTRSKMIRSFYKGRPVEIEAIKNPITRSFLEFFKFKPIRVPSKTLFGKEWRKIQQ